MTTYRIANWEDLFETCETKKLAWLKWVPVPNKHDGLGFRKMVAQRERCELFTAWNLILQVASKSKRGERGSLTRQGKSLSAEDLATMTGFPVAIFEKALEFFSSPEIGWLTVDGQQPPANAGGLPATAGGSPAEWNGMEGNGKNRNILADARSVLFFLNEKASRKFSECPEHLKPISKRLEDCKGDVLGCQKMIARQCAQWGGTEMEKYLRPATLFNKTKFRGYYDDRNEPVQSKLPVNGHGIKPFEIGTTGL
jgi:uncharacterized phage protein (TIGR02220 family)